MVIRYHNENMNSIEDLEQSAGWKAALDEAKQGASEGGVVSQQA